MLANRIQTYHDPPTMKGYISIQFTFFCSCHHWEYANYPKSKDAQREMKSKGWRFTNNCGWLCPACVKASKMKT